QSLGHPLLLRGRLLRQLAPRLGVHLPCLSLGLVCDRGHLLLGGLDDVSCLGLRGVLDLRRLLLRGLGRSASAPDAARRSVAGVIRSVARRVRRRNRTIVLRHGLPLRYRLVWTDHVTRAEENALPS